MYRINWKSHGLSRCRILHHVMEILKASSSWYEAGFRLWKIRKGKSCCEWMGIGTWEHIKKGVYYSTSALDERFAERILDLQSSPQGSSWNQSRHNVNPWWKNTILVYFNACKVMWQFKLYEYIRFWKCQFASGNIWSRDCKIRNDRRGITFILSFHRVHAIALCWIV